MFRQDSQDQPRYDAKIAECRALQDSTDDPLARACYRALASEFEGRAARERGRRDDTAGAAAPAPWRSTSQAR